MSVQYEKSGDLFILGAGSSYPYGMPLGSELLSLIKNFQNYFINGDDRLMTVTLNYKKWNTHKYPALLQQHSFEKISRRHSFFITALKNIGITDNDITTFF